MQFWWVNQNQTYKQEVTGGYLWSPKFKKNGARNIFYDNMTKVEQGDIVFSFCDTSIKTIGIVQQTAESMPIPSDFGTVGDTWDSDGWLVKVDYHELSHTIRPKDNMSILTPLLPNKYSPLQANGNGNQAVYLTEISTDLANQLIELIGTEAMAIVNQISVDIQYALAEQQAEDAINQNTQIGPTERAQLIKARRGQGVFRINVERIEKCCRVTKATAKELLIASHIKPWVDSNDQEKIDGNNGLLLAPHVDKLFDGGYISFEQDGTMLISPRLDQNIFRQWGIAENLNVGRFSDAQEVYLKYHRERVFYNMLSLRR